MTKTKQAPAMVRVERTFPSSTYRSQGYGAAKYAKVAAELHADIWRDAGYEARVVEVDRMHVATGYDWRGRPYANDDAVTYAVEVPADAPMDHKVLTRDVPWPEFMARIWARGCNPMVFFGGFDEIRKQSDAGLARSREASFRLPGGAL